MLSERGGSCRVQPKWRFSLTFDVTSCLGSYFALLIVLGNWMLINLFVAILLQKFFEQKAQVRISQYSWHETFARVPLSAACANARCARLRASRLASLSGGYVLPFHVLPFQVRLLRLCVVGLGGSDSRFRWSD